MLNYGKGASQELNKDGMRKQIIIESSGLGLYLLPIAEGSREFLEMFVRELGLKNLDDIKADTNLPKAEGILGSVLPGEFGEELLKTISESGINSDLLFHRPRKLAGEEVSNIMITVSSSGMQALLKSQPLPPLPPPQSTQS